jgi:hypothetical protein
MNDAQFWRLIDVLRARTDPAAVELLITELTALSDPDLEAFATHLAKAVHDLDSEALFAQPVDTDEFTPEDVDEDLFVAVRCAVVAAGRAAYEVAQEDPGELSRRHDWQIADAESILQAADWAYERRTGQSWTFAPDWETETSDKPAGPVTPPFEADASEWIDVDYHFDADEIADLSDDESWFGPMFGTGLDLTQQLLADTTLRQQYAALGVRTVSITVHFLSAGDEAPKRVKRRADAVEITVGRHLSVAVATSPQLRQWMDAYLRDSLTLGLGRLAARRSSPGR